MPSTVWSGTKTFSATGGEASVVAIPMPHRATLRAYSLVQTSGANAGATCKLLNSKRDAEPNSALPEDNFLVTSFSIPNGEASKTESDVQFSYLNRDGSPSNGQRFLYLKITPGGTGAKEFAFAVTVDTVYLS
jgi:hypothetical protein